MENDSSFLIKFETSVEQPQRPFSHPSEVFNKKLSTSVNNKIYSDSLSNPRPASTPLSIFKSNYNFEKAEEFALLLSETQNKDDLDNFLNDNDSPVKEDVDFEALTTKDEVEELELVDNTTKDLYGVIDSNIPVGPFAEINDELCQDELNRDLNETILKTGVKRPHSAFFNYETNCFDFGDSLLRPMSAPKCLIVEQDVSSCMNSILTSEVTTSISFVSSNDKVADVPKSSLEALVASNSPLMFFSHEFSIDSDVEDKSYNDLNLNIVQDTVISNIDNTFGSDLVLSNTDFLVKLDGDVNTNNNSVSSSKSLTSLDLNDSSASDLYSHGGQKFEFSDNILGSNGSIDNLTTMNQTKTTTSWITEYLQAIRNYAAELCPVDCVIFIEQCRPFNCDTVYMKYFRDQYLCPILRQVYI